MVGGRYMYNFDGIYFQMKSSGILFLVLGIISLLLSRCWNRDKKDTKEMLMGLVCVVLASGSVIYHLNIISNPKILTYEGYYISENRFYKHLLKREYCFSNRDNLKLIFYLDVLTKKEIYPDDFSTGQKYRIFYEEESDIIVKVEEIQ